MADIRVLVFDSGTFNRAELSKMTEQELWHLWEKDDDEAQVRMYSLDEFSCAFNDEEVNYQNWLYFVDYDNIKQSGATTEDEDDNTVAVVVLQFDDDDNFKKAQRIFDSEGESKYWAADWNENTRTIYFTDGGDLQSLSADLIKELDQYGIMGYTRIIRQPIA